MDYLFSSEGCPGCIHIKNYLDRNIENWTGYVQIVDVKFDNKNKELRAYIKDEDTGPAPVGVVPAYYSGETQELITGVSSTLEGIKNANWNNQSQICD